MKKYIVPAMKMATLETESIIAGSMDTLGRGYNASDVSYTKGESMWATDGDITSSNAWGDDEW